MFNTLKLKTISTTIMLLATAALATSVVGCSEPEVAEARATTTSRLGAPLPLVKAQASAGSNDKLGIKEWRVYRGKNDVLLTGYNAKGSAVKGLSVGFHTQNDGTILRTRVMDGSLFAARHDYGRSQTAANGAMSDDTASFVKQALSDFKKLSVATHLKVVAPHNTTTRSLHTSTPSTTGIDPACGADMMAVLTNALQCVQSAGTSSTSSTSTQANPTQLQQCLAAAQSASASSGVCSSTVPVDGAWDATQDGTGCYDTDEGAWDSGWGANGGWGSGGYGTGADGMGAGGSGGWGANGGGWGDGAGGAGGAGSGSGGAGWGNGGPGGTWGNDPFGDGACPSCGGAGWGGGGDICGDSGNGGAGYGGETGGGGGGGWGDGW